MAAPNMLALNSIYGSTALIELTTNAETVLLSNPAASGKVFKVNAVYVCNTNTTTAYNITISVNDAAAILGTDFPIASTVSVPANSSIVVVDKDANLYIEENMSLGGTASTGNELVIVVTYEACS